MPHLLIIDALNSSADCIAVQSQQGLTLPGPARHPCQPHQHLQEAPGGQRADPRHRGL